MTSGGDVVVRRATQRHAVVLAELLFRFNTEFEVPTPSVAEFAARFEEILPLDSNFALLADTASGANVAFAYVTLRPSPYGHGPIVQLEELYVEPPLRGRGIGTVLMERLLRESLAVDAIEVQINVDEVDADTRRFYESHGFVNIEAGTDYRMLTYTRKV